jgi:light-regulated signal transduction histidine kinase (bacteriophytochrome)/ActR/RegA family two-component response regulator
MDNQSFPAEIDLTECEREPICHLGLIQPHGHLLAVKANGEITHASENVGKYLAKPAHELLGRSLGQVLGTPADRLLRDVTAHLGPGQLHHEIWQGELEFYSLWVHQRAGRYLFEWEQLPGQSRTKNIDELMTEGLLQIGRASSIVRQVKLAAELAEQVSGFDRVMIYQFHPDWSGEVIAEVRQPRAEPFLGLRYPASDIPPQARKLYIETLLRVLVDVYATPLNILALPSETTPLDLTFSQLRAMSPYHIEYLKNMKVGATATASLLVNGQLWGLIACHHERRKALTPPEKRALGEIAKGLSGMIEQSAAQAKRLAGKRVQVREKVLQANISGPQTALSQVLFGPERLRNLVHACGTAVWTSQGSLRMGESPTLDEISLYAEHLLAGSADQIVIDSRNEMIARLGFAPGHSAMAGLIALVVSRNPALILFGFRLEASRDIIWGGDIREPVLRDEQTGALSPRRSFAHYKQSIHGKAAYWGEEDLANSGVLLRALRTAAPGPAQIAQMIDAGLSGVRALATDDYPLHSSLLDAIGSGISLLYRSDSDDSTLRYANQSLLELTETCSPSRAQLPSIAELLEAIGLPEDFVAQCEAQPRQIAIPTLHEGFRHFLVEKKLAFEIADARGTVSLSALLFTDTTRAERAREAFDAAQDRAKHLAFLKASFLANMSHEIRTPMNGILGMVQLLQNTRKDQQQQKYLDVIQRSGDSMLSIINDILDLSKIEAGRVDVEKLPFDLTAVVEGVLDLLRPRAEDKGVVLAAAYDARPPRTYLGDAFRLRQVLLNIVGNAVKFTSVGRILISVRCQEQIQRAAPVVISVADTGIGIPADQLAQVFDKFHQADQSTTRKHGGTGLGLAISRELVELMGGTISLASTVDVGSTFTISLPLARSIEPLSAARATEDLLAASGAHRATPVGPGGGRRILVAEDDLTNQIVIQAMLESQGLTVDIAESGVRALELLRARRYELILMDCHMPEMDGYETTARIRSGQEPQQNIPIVALTASVLKEDRQRCLDVGMNDYLSKPIKMETLWQTLRKWNCLAPEAESVKAGKES